jgi:hypothetical protein
LLKNSFRAKATGRFFHLAVFKYLGASLNRGRNLMNQMEGFMMKANKIDPVTVQESFARVGWNGDHVLSVCPGVPVVEALGYASSILEAALWVAFRFSPSDMDKAGWEGLICHLESSKALVDASFRGLLEAGS